MRRLCAALAATLALAARAQNPSTVPDEDETWHTRLVLHARYTARSNEPGTWVYFDPSTKTFDVSSYLTPSEDDRYGSMFASFGVDGRFLGGDLLLHFTADTGELRAEHLPGVRWACASNKSGTGLDVVGSGKCNAAIGAMPQFAVPVETTVPEGRTTITANGRPVAQEFGRTLFVREAYLSWSFGKNDFATVRGGRKRFSVADGYVYDDYGSGLGVDLDLGALGPSFDVGADLVTPTRDFKRPGSPISPLLSLHADWLPSLFEHAGLFFAAYRDVTGSVAELFRSAALEPYVVQLQGAVAGTSGYQLAAQGLARTLGFPAQSTATLVWLGTSGNLFPRRGHSLAWTAAIVRGQASGLLYDPIFENPDRTFDFDVAGSLVSLRYTLDLPRDTRAGAFFLYETGGSPPQAAAAAGRPVYRGFVGISPYVTTTNIFFNGGFAESFAARQATAPGMNARGVIAPGLTFGWEPSLDFDVDARGAWLFADEPGPYGGVTYGPEADLNVTWSPTEHLVFGLEADVLVPGDFFEAGPPVTKLIFAVDVVKL